MPPVFRFVTGALMGLPPEVARLVHVATAILIPWPAAIGYRRFYQGILVRHGLTRRVAYGTVRAAGVDVGDGGGAGAGASLHGRGIGAPRSPSASCGGRGQPLDGTARGRVDSRPDRTWPAGRR